MRLQTAFAIVAFGCLDRVTEDDGRREEYRSDDEEHGDQRDEQSFETEGERHDEQRDGRGVHEVTDSIRQQSPVSDAAPAGVYRIVVR